MGEARRVVHRLALGQVDEDVHHRLVLVAEIDTGDDVGAVLARRQGGRLVVRRRLRERVDARPARLAIAHGVGMDGNEEFGLGGPRLGDTVAQTHEDVVVALREFERDCYVMLDRRRQSELQRPHLRWHQGFQLVLGIAAIPIW